MSSYAKEKDYKKKPRRALSTEHLLMHSLVISVILVTIFSLLTNLDKITEEEKERSTQVLASVSPEILRALTRVNVYDDRNELMGGCSSTTTLKAPVPGGTMITTLLIDHCTHIINPGKTVVTLTNPYMTEPTTATAMLCREYEQSQFSDNPALCSFVAPSDSVEITPLDPSLLNPEHVWQLGDVVTAIGFPGESIHTSDSPPYVFADRGVVTNISRAYFLKGITTEIGCGDYESHSGGSGGPQLVDKKIVAVNIGACLGSVSENLGDGGVDIPPDYHDFEEHFFQESLARVNDVLMQQKMTP